jgi:transposase
LGHIVKLISPQYVKPFVKGNKNDRNDAQAITEAASRPDMRFVPVKNVEQQDIQNIHRVRQRLLTERTALSNQIRGLLSEYGVCIAKGFSTLKKRLPEILEDAENELTAYTRELIWELQEEFMTLDKRVLIYDNKLKILFKTNKDCQRIAKIEGIGPIVATAVMSRLGNPKQFKNGRHFAAFLGLVPRQVSSGGKEKLLGISKRGDVYLRTLLIHGARSALMVADKKTDNRSLWLQKMKERCGINRTSVALANKNARIIWSLVAHQQEYDCVI